jgi:hypothetical protein
VRLRTPAGTGATRARRLGRAAVGAAAGVLALVVLPVPNASATAYRYWSYWVGGDGGWTFASQGAARIPADGTVDGWRFAVSPATGSSTPPRTASTFADVCAGTAPVAGHKRVGVVIDYGTADDAPPNETAPAGPVAACVVVAEDATGYAVLDAATDLRVQSGLVCGVSGYPASGCGEPVAPGSGSGTGSGGGSEGGSSPRPEGGPDEATAGSAATPGTVPGAGGGDGTSSGGPTPRASSTRDATEPSATPTDVAGSAEASPLAAPAEVPADVQGGPPVGLLVGLAVVGALAAAAVALARSRG